MFFLWTISGIEIYNNLKKTQQNLCVYVYGMNTSSHEILLRSQ